MNSRGAHARLTYEAPLMDTNAQAQLTHGPAPYRRPLLRLFGTIADLTLTRSMNGNMDGAPGNGNMSRTG